MQVIFTIGHSSHPIDKFIGLLHQHKITAIADVRSHPYSRHFPHYSQEYLKCSLSEARIAYAFLGKELGARSENPACYRNGKVDYELLAHDPLFQKGLARLRKGLQHYRIALMCAEKDPLDCHRAILISRELVKHGIQVIHILADRSIESHSDMEKRLLRTLQIPETDMFRSKSEILQEAYRIRSEQIAYRIKEGDHR